MNPHDVVGFVFLHDFKFREAYNFVDSLTEQLP